MSQPNNPLRMVRLSAAACIVEKITGDKPNPSTIFRWHSRGLKGVKLQTAFAGGHRRTNETWIRQFFDAVTEAADGPKVTPAITEGSVDRELDAAGI